MKKKQMISAIYCNLRKSFFSLDVLRIDETSNGRRVCTIAGALISNFRIGAGQASETRAGLLYETAKKVQTKKLVWEIGDL